MKNEEIEIMINEFIDGELEKGKEPLLFSTLSQNEKARDYFKNLSLIKGAAYDSALRYPDDLDVKIITSLGSQFEQRSSWKFNTRRYSFLGYAAAIILLFLSMFFFNQSANYQRDLEMVTHRVNEQQQMLQLLFNSLPAAEVNTQFENEIVIRAQL